MTEPLQFREACPADLDTLRQLEAAAHPYPWPDATLSWAISQPGVLACILEEGEQIAGYAFLECVLDEATLLNITIQTERQGQGLGQALLHHCLTLLDPGIRRILLEVRVSNQAARALYARTGFVEIARRRDYYPAGAAREDAIVMEYRR